MKRGVLFLAAMLLITALLVTGCGGKDIITTIVTKTSTSTVSSTVSSTVAYTVTDTATRLVTNTSTKTVSSTITSMVASPTTTTKTVTSTVTKTVAPLVVTLDVLNPRGELAPVAPEGLSNPRLDTLAGKTIATYAVKSWSIPQIRQLLQARYPTIKFVNASATTVKTADAFIVATGD